jgi:hypothetical protein
LSDELHAEHREGCGDVEAERFWEDHYRRRGRVWSPEETLAPLDLSPDEWHTERLEAREREATGPNGQRATVTDKVIAVGRLAR